MQKSVCYYGVYYELYIYYILICIYVKIDESIIFTIVTLLLQCISARHYMHACGTYDACVYIITCDMGAVYYKL